MKTDASEDFGTLIDDNAVIFERRLPGSTALVWCYLTTKELLATWLGEGRFECRIGGNVRLFTSESAIQGVVTECKLYRRLGYSWNVVPNAGASEAVIGWESYVNYELKARGDQVLLRVTHSPIPYAYSPRTFALWHAFLDRLLASMRQVQPEPLGRRFNRLLPEYHRRIGARRAVKNRPRRRISGAALAPSLQLC